QLAHQDLLRLREAALTTFQAGAARQQPLGCRYQRRAVELARQRARQQARLANQRREQIATKLIVGGRAKEIVEPDPAGDAAAQDVGPPGDVALALVALEPFVRQRARMAPRRVATDRSKVAQPFETVE